MPKRHPTFMYFNQVRKVYDGVKEMPLGETPPTPTPSGFIQYEAEVDWEGVAETILKYATPEATFFLDASFVGRKDYPDCLWDALLSRRIIFTPLVWQECQDWLKTPFANKRFRDQVLEAQEKGSDRIIRFDPQSWDQAIRASARYYIALIGARKMAGLQLQERLTKLNGTEPSRALLVARLQKHFGDRGLPLALKGLDEYNQKKATFFADEELVVVATMYAILTGRESYVWTQDPDAIEQMYKVQYLMDTHHRSFFISKYYQENRTTTTEQTIELVEGSRMSEWLEPPSILSVFFHKEDLPDVVLPKERPIVPVCCHRFVDQGETWKVQNLAFGTDQNIKSVLEIKGANNGLNTLDLDGRNLHMVCNPPFPKEFSGRVFIAQDKTTTFYHTVLACLDVHYAQFECERFRHNLYRRIDQ